ncbi:sulfite exporter TauE/SafE family protein [Arcicella sp. LKC2W]|uniref:sulfite exporter TauE/SafE family protein n=1 Tax=Arcicella sp. LKC2W TaxID=2984198 RepID=UPI002B1FF176|nr:sulfite exporter TauE/SafE family protein [Arcicella sp. LKC2W]MEA5458224.1 sulfite exporter TauE/SafE family protein [Arcicella sp. LKC2W]
MDYQLLLMCCAALLAGFVDSIVGGGGLVQVPALFILFPHFEIPRIIGTNRFSSFMGTAVAGYQYSKKVEIPWRTVIYAGIGAGVMAFLGAKISDIIDEKILKPVILILMTAIAIYTFTKKDLGQDERLKFELAKVPLYGLIIGSSAGFYNGFVGPGTGSLLVFGFVSVIGYGFLKASAISKIINVIADVCSLGYFIVEGYVQYEIAIPMMICNMAGSYLGSKMAILKGNEFVRTFFLFVIFALILRFAWDIFK